MARKGTKGKKGKKGKKGSELSEELAGAVEPKARGSDAKAMIIVLLVLDLLAAGAFLYVKLGLAESTADDYRAAERLMLSVKRKSSELRQLVSTIKGAELADVTDPGPLISEIANNLDLREEVSVGKATERAWPGGQYVETNVAATFNDKNGYSFYDLIRFLNRIERKNPKILIKQMNFGEQRLGEEVWRPHGRALIVRAFKLK